MPAIILGWQIIAWLIHYSVDLRMLENFFLSFCHINFHSVTEKRISLRRMQNIV